MVTKKKIVSESTSEMGERLLKLLLENTLKADKPKSSEEKPTPEIAKRLQSVMDKADFGCQSAHVAEAFSAIASAIAGEKVEITRKKPVAFMLWRDKSVIVPLKNTVRHNYALGKPILAMGNSSNCIRMSGDEGNNMSKSVSSWRYATKEEVETFVLGAEIMGGIDTILKYVGLE